MRTATRKAMEALATGQAAEPPLVEASPPEMEKLAHLLDQSWYEVSDLGSVHAWNLKRAADLIQNLGLHKNETEKGDFAPFLDQGRVVLDAIDSLLAAVKIIQPYLSRAQLVAKRKKP